MSSHDFALRQPVRRLSSIEALEPRRLLAGTTTSLAVGDVLYTAVSSGTPDGGSDLYRSNLDGSNRLLLKHWVSGDYGPSSLIGFHNQLFFAANWPDYGGGQELWTSNGTPEGTVQVRDIYGGSQGSFPHDFMIVNDHLLFVARSNSLLQQIYVTDGTLAGTIQLITPASAYQSGVSNLIVLNDRLYAEVGNPVQTERWQTDGTLAGTRMADPLGILYPNGILRVYATNSADAITMTAHGGATRLTINGTVTQSFRSRDVGGIELHGLIGDDTITLDDSVRVPATLIGNTGADHLRGGGEDDHLYGGREGEAGDHDVLDGGDGNDFFNGSAFSVLIGGDGDDVFDTQFTYRPITVLGGAGNDRFIPTDAFDDAYVFDGGPGTDTLDLARHAGPIAGGGGSIFVAPTVSNATLTYSGVERLLATDKDDHLTLTDNDSIRFIDALKGNDVLVGGAQAETFVGGEGDDILEGNGGDDLLVGGGGHDGVDGGAGHNTIIGAVRADSITANPADVVQDALVQVFGDTLYVVGSSHNDTINLLPGPGNGGQLRALVNGQSYKVSARQVGDMTAISLAGGDGDDQIAVSLGVPFPATLRGDAGNDTITPGGGDDFVDGSDGTDTLDYTPYTDALNANGYYLPQVSSDSGGTDTYLDFETLLGGSGDDQIYRQSYSGSSVHYIDGESGDDHIEFGDDSATGIAPTVHGGAGDDWISITRPYGGTNVISPSYYFGDEGNDTLTVSYYNADLNSRDFNGGPGVDTVDYGPIDFSVHVTIDDLPDDGEAGFGFSSHDNVHTDIEIVCGTYNPDTIIGGDHNESLYGGGGGPDLLIGNGGDDWLEDLPAYDASNTLAGGAGHDTLVSTLANDDHPDVLDTDATDVLITGGVWQISGTAGDDVIHVGLVPGDPQTVRATVNAQTYDVPLVFADQSHFHFAVTTRLKGINLFGAGGTDSITVDPNVGVPVMIILSRPFTLAGDPHHLWQELALERA